MTQPASIEAITQAPAQSTVHQIKTQFESLTLATVPDLALLYASDAHFKDPFNAVQGRDKIAHIFSHMFTQVQAPRFIVTKVFSQAQDQHSNTGLDVFLRWDFHFKRQGKDQKITGATHLDIAANGLILSHVDYWDAAEQLYEGVPLLGAVLRWIKRKLSAHTI